MYECRLMKHVTIFHTVIGHVHHFSIRDFFSKFTASVQLSDNIFLIIKVPTPFIVIKWNSGN